MRSVSSRAPSMRCAGASDEMIQLSTTEPMLEPMKPPMVAALTPRIAPPMLPPMAAPAAPRMRVAMGPRGAWVKRRRRRRPVRVVLRPTEGVQTRATPSPPGVPATRVMRWLRAATARPPRRRPRSAFDDGGRAGRCGDLRSEREPDCRRFNCGRSVGGSTRRQCCDASVRSEPIAAGLKARPSLMRQNDRPIGPVS